VLGPGPVGTAETAVVGVPVLELVLAAGPERERLAQLAEASGPEAVDQDSEMEGDLIRARELGQELAVAGGAGRDLDLEEGWATERERADPATRRMTRFTRFSMR
jgi:hypothetical protein